MRKIIRNSLLAIALACGCTTVKAEEPEEEEETDIMSLYSCRAIDTYNYEAPVPYSEAIENSYYNDVLFAGDSRMGSLYLYGDHKNADVYYVTSLNLLMIDTMKVDEEELSDEEKEEEPTLLDILSRTTKDNVYLLFGINEIRNPNFDAYGEQLDMIIKMLRENNPKVNVYVILSYHPDLITGLPEPDLTEHLNDLNTKQIEIAQNNHVYYLNLDDGMDDADGTIVDDYVYDGLHFTVDGTTAFEDYLATHVAREEKYVKETCE